MHHIITGIHWVRDLHLVHIPICISVSVGVCVSVGVGVGVCVIAVLFVLPVL